MNKIEVGNVYTAARQRSGDSQRGPWELIAVLNERGKEEITVFAKNIPSGVVEGQQFLVKEIHSTTFRFRKDQNERWQPNVNIEATVQPVKSDFDDTDGNPWDDIDTNSTSVNWSNITVDDGSLPF